MANVHQMAYWEEINWEPVGVSSVHRLSTRLLEQRLVTLEDSHDVMSGRDQTGPEGSSLKWEPPPRQQLNAFTGNVLGPFGATTGTHTCWFQTSLVPHCPQELHMSN